MNNYHRHSHYSNIMSPDSAVTNEQYAKRAVELGDRILSSCEHGFQGNYFETFTLAQKYGLKFIYSCEAYWVKDRFEQDKTNNHIHITAKTDKGRKALNMALSEANITGYYYKPRLDLDLILNLPSNDVFVTTACIGFWHYEDTDEIILKMHNHFKDNFMLEVQMHSSHQQKKLNKRIIQLSEKYNIKIIAGQDSHYITQDQAIDRTEVLLSKGVRYDDEDGWYMDYPTNDMVIERFKNQGVLTDIQIKEAIENTKVFETFDDLSNIDIFSKRIKLPTLYPQLSQKERNQKLVDIVTEKWNEFKKDVPKDLQKTYVQEIKKELSTVFKVNMADYFLIDYEIVKLAVSRGGMITPSGRGSAVSYFINTLLGLSKIDRITAPVKMFPERFLSENRIGSIPDIDLNVGDRDIFTQAQREIFGEYNSYPMIAYGTFKSRSAFKMYSKAKGIDFQLANQIGYQLEKYETELKHAEEDEKDLIDVYDYLSPEFHDLYRDSIIYQGIVSGKTPHPCAWLLFDRDIREEIGILYAKSESAKEGQLVSLMDGLSAEKFFYLKNDWLKVDSVLLMYKLQERTGLPIPTQKEIIDICENDSRVTDIYSRGCTIGINQCEKASTTQKAMKYKLKNIAEASAFIAGIRPSFKTMYNKFENRENFSYGIPSFDKMIRECGVEASWLLYQEMLMQVLGYAGIPMSETYDVIKAISKKRVEKISSVKEVFSKQFKELIMKNDGLNEQEADEAVDKVWHVIIDSAQYGFNASHSFSMAFDSLVCAYYKALRPLEFYEVLLQEYTKKGKKDKVTALKEEMQEHFNIKALPFKFGQDNRTFVSNIEDNAMQQDMNSLKGFGSQVSVSLYEIYQSQQFNSFIDVLQVLKQSTINQTQIQILIKLDYFKEFGESQKLLDIYNMFEWIDKKQISKEKENPTPFPIELIQKYSNETEKQYRNIDFTQIISECINVISNDSISVESKLIAQKKHLGYLDKSQFEENDIDSNYIIVLYSNKQYTPRLKVKSLVGKVYEMRIEKKNFNYDINEGTLLYCNKITVKPAKIKNEITGKYEMSKTKRELWLDDYSIIDL